MPGRAQNPLPGYDPDALTPPEREENAEAADMPQEELHRAYREGSEHFRQVLTELARHPTTPRPCAVIEENLGWTRGVLTFVLGGWGNTSRVSFARKRPYRIGRNDDGTWWMWMDAEVAAAVALEAKDGHDRG